MKCRKDDPVFYMDEPWEDEVDLRDPGWYYWDETWTAADGPFDTEELAREACTKYAAHLEEGRPSGDYDSAPATHQHINEVRKLLNNVCMALQQRVAQHDQSKLKEPEKAIFDEFTPKLKALTYGSDEYKQALEDMGVALKHHYEVSRHHPEHFELGINQMNLVDIMEMFCDWLAATQRHDDGDIFRSIDQNEERFAYSSQIRRLFHNTAAVLTGVTLEEPAPEDSIFSIECYINSMRKITDKLTEAEAKRFRRAAIHLYKYLTDKYKLLPEASEFSHAPEGSDG